MGHPEWVPCSRGPSLESRDCTSSSDYSLHFLDKGLRLRDDIKPKVALPGRGTGMTSTVLGLQGHILDHQALLPHKQLPGEVRRAWN